MSRQTDLIDKAIAALGDGRDPLELAFLSEHRVTLDECYQLADQMALGLRLLRRLQADLKAGGLAATVAANRLAEALLA